MSNREPSTLDYPASRLRSCRGCGQDRGRRGGSRGRRGGSRCRRNRVELLSLSASCRGCRRACRGCRRACRGCRRAGRGRRRACRGCRRACGCGGTQDRGEPWRGASGDVATDGLLSVARSVPPGNDGFGFRDDGLPDGGAVVAVVTTTFAVVVVLLLVVVGTVVVPLARWTKSVGGAVSEVAKAHTSTPVTASTPTTSATLGRQTPSR